MTAAVFRIRTSHPDHHRVRQNCEAALTNACRVWDDIQVTIEAYEERRSGDQNSLLWSRLQDVADQVVWYGKRLTKDEWKDVFTAALKRHTVVPGIDGGFVVVGASTSRMSKRTMTELLELIAAFGAEHKVRWTLDV